LVVDTEIDLVLYHGLMRAIDDDVPWKNTICSVMVLFLY